MKLELLIQSLKNQATLLYIISNTNSLDEEMRESVGHRIVETKKILKKSNGL